MPTDRTDPILDSIADGVFTVDDQWRITSWNRAAHAITGFTRDEALGRQCSEVFRTDACARRCALRSTMGSGREAVDVRVTMRARDGTEKPLSISTAVLKDASGRAVGGVETFRDLSELELLRRQLRERFRVGDIVSKSHRIQEILRVLPDIAAAGSTVLIQGPSGSGKELFARAIHDGSPRRDRPFVALNCAALPDTLLESELFGHKAGAFTDARHDRIGRFAAAQGGTLFLDEIGDISTALQVKLLRVLQEKEYQPLGSSRTVKADARVVTATNRDLRQLMAEGRFRDDLFYRLNVVRIELPALRDRKEDIPLLVRHFIQLFAAQTGREIRGVTPNALDALLRYDFPGNIRELEHAIEHAFVLCRGPNIDVCCLPPEIARGPLPDLPPGPATSDAFDQAQAVVIRAALAENGGHRVRTAQALGIHKATLMRKMRRFAIRFP
jgi:PAS domain S-box-containing protein